MQGFLIIVLGNVVYGRPHCRPSIDDVLGQPYHRLRETLLVTAYSFLVSNIS